MKRYIWKLFRAEDHVSVLAVRRRGDIKVEQRFPTAEQAGSPKYQRWLRHLNAKGYDVYLGVNPVRPERGKREKQDISEVRRLQVDLDNDGPAGLKRILQDVGRGALPKPAHVLRSSENRYQVLWNAAEGQWDSHQAEGVMSGLAAKYGGDPAVADVARVMRIPGLRNKKPGRGNALVSWTDYGGRAVTPEDFRGLPQRSAPVVGNQDHKGRNEKQQGISQSERDWAYVRSRLRKGAEPETLIQRLEAQRQDKPKPGYYARRTVTRAVESLRAEQVKMSMSR